MRNILFAALVLGASPAFADEVTAGEDAKLSGLRVEARVGIERPNLNDKQNGTTYVAKLSSSVAFGGEIGYDVPVSGSVTVGPYASYDVSSSEKCESYSPGAVGVSGVACFKSNSNLSLGLRGGFRVGSKAEAYIAVGYDVYDADFTVNEVNGVGGNVFSYTSPGNRKGVGFGFGANYNVSKNVYAGVGMKISELGEFEGSSFKLQRFQGHVALGVRL